MPSCWPPVAWPSLPCSTSCSDPAHSIRKTGRPPASIPVDVFFYGGPAGRCDPPRPARQPTARQADNAAGTPTVHRGEQEKGGKASPISSVPTGGRTSLPGRSKETTPACHDRSGSGRANKMRHANRTALPGRTGRMDCRVTDNRYSGKGSAFSRVPGRMGRHELWRNLSRPLREAMPAGRRKAGRTEAGRRIKKTTGCPGGGAAGQRGRMF